MADLSVQRCTEDAPIGPTFTAFTAATVHRLKTPDGSADFSYGAPLVIWVRKSAGTPVTIAFTANGRSGPWPDASTYGNATLVIDASVTERVLGVLSVGGGVDAVELSYTGSGTIAVLDAGAMRRSAA